MTILITITITITIITIIIIIIIIIVIITIINIISAVRFSGRPRGGSGEGARAATAKERLPEPERRPYGSV